MSLEFEGDVADMSEIQLNLIRVAFNKHGHTEGVITIESVGKVGDNFCANIKRLTIQGHDRPFKMVAKVAPKQETLRAITNTTIAFQNETFMYTEVLPKLTELQKSVGTPDEEVLRYPACYGTLDEAPNELLVLEDLKELGFGLRDKFCSLNDEEVRVVLKNLATLHALGFVLKEREPQLHEDAKKKLVNLWQKFAEMEDFFQNLIPENSIISLLDSELHKELAKGKLTNVWAFMKESAKMEADSPHVCIIQGDCWINNIMFRDDVTKPDCIMIDYQVSRVTSPIVDLVYFIFNCTDRETRKDNYFNWIDYYYAVFTDILARFEMKASNVYSRVEIHNDLKVYGSYMYGLAVFFLNFTMRESEEIIDMKSMTDEEFKEGMGKMEEYYDPTNLKSSSVERFKSRLLGLTLSFIEYGYI